MPGFELEEIKSVKEEARKKDEMFQHRIIFCDEIITSETAKDLWSDLFKLTAGNDKRPITYYINSPGGNLHEGLAMGGILEACLAPVSIIGVAKVCSAAVFPFAAGARRFAYPYTTFLMHDFSTVMAGKLPELRSSVDYMDLLKREILEYLSRRTKQDVEWWEGKFTTREKRDYWFNVQEAVEIGLVDEIIQPGAILRLKK